MSVCKLAAIVLLLLSACSPGVYKRYGPRYPSFSSDYPIELLPGDAPPYAEVSGELSYSYSRSDRLPTVAEAMEVGKAIAREHGADALCQIKHVQRDQSGLFYLDVTAKTVRYLRDASGRITR